jgi:hypothetical protein
MNGVNDEIKILQHYLNSYKEKYNGLKLKYNYIKKENHNHNST